MKPFSRRTHSIIRDGGRAAGILIAATLVGLLFSGLKIPEANIIAVYILGVLIISIITSSWMYSFLASVISVLAFNFLFTIPRFTLRAYDPSYPVTFGIMFLVALITGSLASRMKEYARESAQAAMQIEKERLTFFGPFPMICALLLPLFPEMPATCFPMKMNSAKRRGCRSMGTFMMIPCG